jgi:hypothetical protein
MLRSLLALFATVSVGATAASASVPAATDQSLEQRLLNAQKQIEMIMSGQETPKPPATEEAYYCGYGYTPYPCGWHNWHNWHNWNNWHNYNPGYNGNY